MHDRSPLKSTGAFADRLILIASSLSENDSKVSSVQYVYVLSLLISKVAADSWRHEAEAD